MLIVSVSKPKEQSTNMNQPKLVSVDDSRIKVMTKRRRQINYPKLLQQLKRKESHIRD
jgi:hypothetical protein